MNTRWTNRSIDRALAELSRAYEPTPDEVLAFESRVHREVDARFGVGAWHERILTDAYGYSRITDKRTDVHTVGALRVGMMEVVFGMVRQPALALRSFGGVGFIPRSFSGVGFALATVVIVVAGVLAYRQSTDSTLANRPRDPQTSSAVAVAPAVPFGEGTGFAVSVFGEALAVAPRSAGFYTLPSERAGIKPAPTSERAGIKPAPTPINPAAGVFTTWGTSVFSDDEALTRPWEGGKSIFSS